MGMASLDNVAKLLKPSLLCFPCLQEVREMVNLPGTRPEMVAADFEGVTEALKGKSLDFI